MSTLALIRDWVREQTLVEAVDWGNDKLNNVINEGVRQVSVKFPWPWAATSSQLSVTATTQAYTFATIVAGTGSTLFRIEAIVDNDRRTALREINSADAFAMYGGDMPDASEAQYFFIWGDAVYLVPTPDTNETDAYTVYYYRSAAALSNESDSPEWDAAFHMVLADYAIARVWEREEEIGKSEAADARFNQGVEQMAQFYLNRAQDYPTVMGGGKTGTVLARSELANMSWLK